MKAAEAKQGRIFVLRLEDGEVLHEAIESFAHDQSIRAAALIVVGGAAEGSKLVVGSKGGMERPVNPTEYILDGVHEVAGTGTLFPDEKGNPILHLHAACGRGDHAVTGCTRSGVNVWQIMEVILFELLDTTAIRVSDPDLGFKMLKI
jgi:predicted DNA-binding protein with PD1-like motif